MKILLYRTGFSGKMYDGHKGMVNIVYRRNFGTYLLSAYDLNMLSYLPELIRAGVRSFKIEGRMKTEYYVAVVTGAYRRAVMGNLLKRYLLEGDLR